MPSIATRAGDDGTTSLLYGQRVSKDHPQIEAIGAFDELNVALGAVKPWLDQTAAREWLVAVQHNLVALMGELACAPDDRQRYATSSFAKITFAEVRRLDDAVAALEAQGLKFDGWATPGATLRSAMIEQARVSARRAERRLVALRSCGYEPRPEILQFVNRLSDLLWLMAREAEAENTT